MKKHNSSISNFLSSEKWYVQVLGALLMTFTKLPLLVSILIIAVASLGFNTPESLKVGGVTISLIIVVQSVFVLTPIYCLQKNEIRITWSQVVFLISLGIWLLVTISQIDFHKYPNSATIISIFSAVLSWIFQDTIKSVVAFFYLRANDLLHIGDWIEVKSHGIDGTVKRVSLTTVTIENWDTTTSAFPVNILHSTHFMNKQKMMEGKTNGRQMLKTFIIDTGWIHTITEEELSKIKKIVAGLEGDKKDFLEYFIEENAKAGVLNIELFRHYIYHWMMHHQHVSHEPRLIVRWLEQVPEGLPLQIYAFITDSSLAPYEWQQSQIIEHVVESMAWFNIQLYQCASGYDASNSNVTIVEKEANYRRKLNDNGKIL